MAVRDGAEQERKRLATKGGLTTAQSVAMTGADLTQKSQQVATAQAVGPGIDGARYAQLEGGSGN